MPPDEFLESVCRTAVANGTMDLTEIRGYSDEEIAQIESVTGLTLPSYYKGFLRKLGKNGGGFMQGTHLFPQAVEVISNWRPWARRLMVRSKSEEVLPESAFIFGDHQGYQFWYFLTCPPVDDPPVYYYREGAKRSKQVHSSFSEFILKLVEEDHRLKVLADKSRREADAARAAFKAKRET